MEARKADFVAIYGKPALLDHLHADWERNGSLGAFSVIVWASSWGPSQPGSENASKWLPGSIFRDSLGLFLRFSPARL